MTEREKWLEQRKGGIGGSDAAAILGLSPYKSNVQLWEEKTGRRKSQDISNKAFVEYGKRAEAPLRELFALEHPEYRVCYDEFKIVAALEKHPWLFATLDGELTQYDESKPYSKISLLGVLEIKTTEIMRSTQWAEWNGQVPQHYYIQVLHQLLATGYDFAILMAQIKAHDRNRDVYYTRKQYSFKREDCYDDMKFLLEKEIAFWDCVAEDRRPSLILPEI